jgi:hypothetical protein
MRPDAGGLTPLGLLALSSAMYYARRHAPGLFAPPPSPSSEELP